MIFKNMKKDWNSYCEFWELTQGNTVRGKEAQSRLVTLCKVGSTLPCLYSLCLRNGNFMVFFSWRCPVLCHTPALTLKERTNMKKYMSKSSKNQRHSNRMVQSKKPSFIPIAPHSMSDCWCRPPHSLVLIHDSDLVIHKPHKIIYLACNKWSSIHLINKLNAFY